MNISNKRKRMKYGIAFLLLLLVEIFIASYVHDDFIRPYMGDILVVVVLYCFVRIFIPEKCRLMPLYIFLFAAAVEGLQYFDFVDRLKLDNLFFRVLIGSVFDWKDILCYGLGCGMLAGYEIMVYKEDKRNILKAIGQFIYKMPFNTTVFFCILMIYYEFIFHACNFKINDGNMPVIILFSIVIGCFLSIFSNLFSPFINKAVTIFLVSVLSVYFAIQFIYHEVFNNYLSLAGTIKYGNQAVDNFATVLRNVKENIFIILLLVLPVIIVCVFIRKAFDFKRRKWWISLIMLASVCYMYFMTIIVLKSNDRSLYNSYQIYSEYTSADMAVEKLGVIEAFIVDTREGIKTAMGMNETDVVFQIVSTEYEAENDNDITDVNETTEAEEAGGSRDVFEPDAEEILDTSPNIINIDFNQISNDTSDDNIKALNDYFSSLTPTNKNEYTGMFEGYNLIWITAEGFSGYVLNSDLFPTLSMMAEEGFVFENYYSPLWYGSTLGGEYANLMGSMPKNGGYLSLSHAASLGNDFAFTMGNQLKRLGYSTIAYHNNSATYYDRDVSHPLLGYEWVANGTGLEAQINASGTTIWPQSDLVMIQDTFADYCQEEPFHIYYLTVSGHVEYNFSGNAMAVKNKDVVADLDYNETTKAYIACQYELEKAMEQLLTYLKNYDLYDNTVIVLAGDHVPYDNMEVLDDLAGYELEDNFEAYKSTLIIWSGSMEQPVKVDKVCSSIDILPTVSNLFGLEYDSRILIGQDILSDSSGLVMFNNRSFITDDFFYNSVTGAAVSNNGAEISEDIINNMKAYVANKFTAADSITELDYYKYIEQYRTVR